MKIFKVVIRRSNFYVNEIKANNFESAKEKAKSIIWHGNYIDQGSDWEDEDVYEIEEIIK